MGTAFSSSGSASKKKAAASKGPVITDTDKAILSLKAQRKKLADQQKLLELRVARHVEVARQLVGEKQNSKALLVLKKKKLAERQLEELGALQLNMETMISNVEMTKQQNKLLDVLQQGNKALQALQKEVTVEDVQKLMDDTAEAKAYQDEINAVLTQSLTEDESEAVASELAALEDEVLAVAVDEMPKAPAVPEDAQKAAEAARAAAAAAKVGEDELPSAPTHEVEAEPAPRVALLAS